MRWRRDGIRVAAVGVVVPVRDEERLLARALSAVEATVRHTAAAGPQLFCTVVVLDSCRDASGAVARRWRDGVSSQGSAGAVHRVRVVESAAGCVGTARRIGCGVVLGEFAALDRHRIWLATTDADSRVPERWLSHQLDRRAAGADAWLGTVALDGTGDRSAAGVRSWSQRYAQEAGPIHGASMGMSGAAYVAAGGFPPLASGEDRALVRSLRSIGADVHHDRRSPVLTSSRRDGRAPSGLAYDLSAFEGAGS